MVETRSKRLKDRRESLTLNNLIYFNHRDVADKENESLASNAMEYNPLLFTSRKEERAKFLKNQLSNTYLHLDLTSDKSLKIQSRMMLRDSFPEEEEDVEEDCTLINNDNVNVINNLSREKQELESRVRELERKAKELIDLVQWHQRERMQLRRQVQQMKGTIRVVARIKPNLGEEGKETEALEQSDNERVLLSVRKRNRASKTSFHFDRVFGQNSSQRDVFDDEVQSFVDSAVDGHNVCLFCYGMTSSGKTFTMTGDVRSDTDKGIVVRAIESVQWQLQRLRAEGWETEMSLKVIEVYNDVEEVLLPETQDLCNVDGKVIVQLLQSAQDKRRTAETKLNSSSSRSHCISVIAIKCNKCNEKALEGTLSLCDLAGSERLKRTGDERIEETCAINKSLSSLKDVLCSLKEKSAHIPFRNSKLTMLLKHCFDGQGRVLMIVNVSSLQQDAQETLCSLRFAADASSTKVTY